MFQQCFFFLKAAEDVFSFQSESLPEVFVTVESEKNFKIILFFARRCLEAH